MAAPAKKKGLAPIKIELPKPLFVGTPQNFRSPNLEKPRKHARPAFMAPKGTTNVAKDKPVTASDEDPIIGEAELITDGDKEGADGSYVEFGGGKQWVQIDLEDNYSIFAIALWHYHQSARVYHDVVIQSAADPDFIMDVKTIFNNDHDNSSGLGIGKDKEYIETFEGKLIDAKGVKARYLRFYSNNSTSGDGNHYIEIEVYGKPAE